MKRLVTSILIILLAVISISTLAACGGGGGVAETPTTASPSAQAPPEPAVITIGNLTDQTGIMSSGLAIVDMALQDVVAHYNERHLIPGVELKVVSFDTQYDPARNEAGYEYLLEHGSDLIFTLMSSPPTDLRDRLDQDGTVICAGGPLKAAVDPPGRVFVCGQTLAEYEVLTLLDWVAHNDPDFPQGRPARIGAAFTAEPYGNEIISAIQAYAQAHPEQYQWVTGYMGSLVFDWSDKVGALADCDYVFPPLEFSRFAVQYRQAGGKARFLGTGYHTGFLQTIYDAKAWDKIDGMLVISSVSWWNEEGEEITLARDLLEERHPDKAEQVIEGGAGYLASFGVRLMLEIVGQAVKDTSPQSFTPELFYQTAQSFEMEMDGCRHSFSPTKRTSPDSLAVFRADGEKQDFFRAHEGWIPIVYGD